MRLRLIIAPLRIGIWIDALFLEQLQIRDFPGAVHRFHGDIGFVLVLAHVDVAPVAHRARGGPFGVEQQAQGIVIELIHIDIQDFDLFDPGPGAAGLGYHH